MNYSNVLGAHGFSLDTASIYSIPRIHSRQRDPDMGKIKLIGSAMKSVGRQQWPG